MTAFNGLPLSVVDMPYTDIDNIFVDLNKNGAIVINNAIDIDKFLHECADKGEKYFDYNSKEFLSLRSYLKTTKTYNKLLELGEPKIFGYVSRAKKNSFGTDIHADDHTLTEKGLHINYLCFWAPLTDLLLEEGMLFFFKSESKEFLNKVKRKNFLDKVTIAKNGLREYYIDSKLFEKDFPQFEILNDDINKFNGVIYSKSLKKGDLIIFKTTTYHGSFDCVNFTRKSIDFRIGFNVPSVSSEEFKNITPIEPRSLVNVFDNQVLSVVTGQITSKL